MRYSQNIRTTPFVHHTKTTPLLKRCFFPVVIIVVVIYITLLISVGRYDIWSIFNTPAPGAEPIAPLIDDHETLSNPIVSAIESQAEETETTNQQETQLIESKVAEPITITITNQKDENENENENENDQPGFVYNADVDYKYIEIMEHLHSTELKDLSNELQSRKLQQLFRYKFNELMLTRLLHAVENSKKPPSDYEVASMMSELYLQHNAKLNFIQVGACDGDWSHSNDPIQKLLLKSEHWIGVMMEPVPYLFKKLEISVENSIKNHEKRIYLLNAALSDRDSSQLFYVVNDKFAQEMPHETHALKYQIGSFNKDHIIKHLRVKRERKQLSQELDAYIDAIDVDAMTPMTVVKKFQDSGLAARDGLVDILLIDAEGYDLVILQSFMNIAVIRPSLIVYENLHLSGPDQKTAIELLNSYGYITYKVGWNTYGVRVAEM